MHACPVPGHGFPWNFATELMMGECFVVCPHLTLLLPSQLSLYKPERLPRVSEKSGPLGEAEAGMPVMEEALPEPPKRSMSRSGSTRLLSSFGELSVAEKTERPPKGPTRAAVEAAAAASRASSEGDRGSVSADPEASMQ